jgi:hypothetical protein
MPWQPSSLDSFWNMYDGLSVWSTYHVGHPPRANISRDDLTRVRGLRLEEPEHRLAQSAVASQLSHTVFLPACLPACHVP